MHSIKDFSSNKTNEIINLKTIAPSANDVTLSNVVYRKIFWIWPKTWPRWTSSSIVPGTLSTTSLSDLLCFLLKYQHDHYFFFWITFIHILRYEFTNSRYVHQGSIFDCTDEIFERSFNINVPKITFFAQKHNHNHFHCKRNRTGPLESSLKQNDCRS